MQVDIRRQRSKADDGHRLLCGGVDPAAGGLGEIVDDGTQAVELRVCGDLLGGNNEIGTAHDGGEALVHDMAFPGALVGHRRLCCCTRQTLPPRFPLRAGRGPGKTMGRQEPRRPVAPGRPVAQESARLDDATAQPLVVQPVGEPWGAEVDAVPKRASISPRSTAGSIDNIHRTASGRSTKSSTMPMTGSASGTRSTGDVKYNSSSAVAGLSQRGAAGWRKANQRRRASPRTRTQITVKPFHMRSSWGRHWPDQGPAGELRGSPRGQPSYPT